MNNLIIVKPDKCTGCNACVRGCPAPEANITRMLDNGKFITNVNTEKCIACGECVKNCKYGARDYIDDTEEFMSRVSQEKMIVLATPSIKVAYPTQWKEILNWFKKKGCLVYDVSFGADICSWVHLKAMEFNKLNNVISQPCAAIVNYIEMYQPKLLQNLSPIHSPAACMAIYIKNYLKRPNPMALLSPCIAKKMECEETGLIQYNVTFKKLMEYFEKNDIRIPSTDSFEFEYDFEYGQGQYGSIYSTPGGLKECILQKDPTVNIVNSEGVQKVYRELEQYANMNTAKRPQIFDVLSCEYGCNVGPATGKKQTGFEAMTYIRQINNELKNKPKSRGLFRSGNDDLFKKFDDELDMSNFIRGYKPAKPSVIPTAKDLDPIFESMGKFTQEERSYDCRACGYTSCQQMATAIFRGQNTPENCIVHAKSVLLSNNRVLEDRDERISKITNECIALSDKLAGDIKDITASMSSINESNSKTKERATVVNDLLKNVVVFCNNNPVMDKATVDQLTKILEATIKAFSVLDENVKITADSSETINNSISQISDIINELNSTLEKSTQQ